MFLWMDRFPGLTPDAVEAMPVMYRDRLMHVAGIVDKMRADAQRAAARG